jgi:hypothetical protein
MMVQRSSRKLSDGVMECVNIEYPRVYIMIYVETSEISTLN